MAKAKITITGSGKSDAYTPYAFLFINDEVYTSAQTVEVDLGTICQCRIGRGTKGVVAVLLDEQVVAEVTTSYGEKTYELTVDRNYEINLEVATGAIISITTGEEVNPMAPHDGHNTNIGQVARQIEGGTVRLGGIGQEIESGLLLVGGVSREISIIKPLTIDITVTGDDYDGNACWLTIDGVKYKETQTIEVKAGTEVTFYSYSNYNSTHTIKLDGATVATSSRVGTINYTMAVEQSLSVTLSVTYSFGNDTVRGSVTIATV